VTGLLSRCLDIFTLGVNTSRAIWYSCISPWVKNEVHACRVRGR
jgi:hypothetical protein